jgi:drug/metabolite transporter (DMT)-like permease
MNPKNFLLLIALSCCWGPSFLLIKLALKSFTPYTLVFFRLFFGGLILLIYNAKKGLHLHHYLHLTKEFFLIGLFANALPFVTISIGEIFIPSSIASIMNSTTPLFTAIFAHLALKDEKFQLAKMVGVFLGMLGIFIIFFPAIEKVSYHMITGCLYVLLGAISYSISFVLTKKRTFDMPKTLFPAGQLLAGSLLVLPFALKDFFLIDKVEISSIFALLGLTLLGTVIAFLIYFHLVKSAGATFVSYSSLLFPSIGIMLGVIFLNETMNAGLYLGSFLIFLGVIVACFYEPLIKKKGLFQKKGLME